MIKSKNFSIKLNDNIGHILKARREALGATQEDVARATGLSRASINHYENGTTKTISKETAKKLDRYYGEDILVKGGGARAAGQQNRSVMLEQNLYLLQMQNERQTETIKEMARKHEADQEALRQCRSMVSYKEAELNELREENERLKKLQGL